MDPTAQPATIYAIQREQSPQKHKADHKPFCFPGSNAWHLRVQLCTHLTHMSTSPHAAESPVSPASSLLLDKRTSAVAARQTARQPLRPNRCPWVQPSAQNHMSIIERVSARAWDSGQEFIRRSAPGSLGAFDVTSHPHTALHRAAALARRGAGWRSCFAADIPRRSDPALRDKE